jgi:hypothetical protein
MMATGGLKTDQEINDILRGQIVIGLLKNKD